MSSLGDRVYLAWMSLPRTDEGEPAKLRPLEAEHGVANGVTMKVVRGKRQNVNSDTLMRMARMLSVSESWLLNGGDGGPTPTGPVPDRRRKYGLPPDENGGVSLPAPPTPGDERLPAELLQVIAMAEASGQFSAGALEALRFERTKTADGKPASRDHYWACLRELQDEMDRAERGEKPRSRKRPPVHLNEVGSLDGPEPRRKPRKR